MAYQSAKLNRNRDKDRLINWIYNIEFNKLKLPKPDLTIFLDVNPSISAFLRKLRGRDDIIESDRVYLNKVYYSYLDLVNKFNWLKLECSIGNTPKSILDIENELFTLVEENRKNLLIKLVNNKYN